MAQLLVRGIEDEVVKRLKVRAAENGVSAEEQHRRILRAALEPEGETSFKESLMAMPDVGDDSIFERTRRYPEDYPRDADL